MTRIEFEAPTEDDGPASPRGDETDAADPQPWHPLKRFLFRAGLPYLLLYVVATPYLYVPSVGLTLSTWLVPFWNHFLVFWNRTVFAVAPDGKPLEYLGVGDTRSHAYLIFGMAMSSLVVGLLWSVVDRRRSKDARIARWAALLMSCFVGSMVIYYGTLKVFDVQFGFPLLDRLVLTYGDSRGLDLVWILMGVSTPYTRIAGLAEVVGGFLLFFRRTRTLGALLLIGVLGHVVMLNFCFALPVKLLSLHLLLMTGILLWPDARRLFHFAIGRPIPSVERSPLVSNPRLEKGIGWLQVVLAITLTFFHLLDAREKDAQQSAERQPIYGIFDVESFAVNGDEKPPLLSDEQRWRLILFDVVDWVMIERMDGTQTFYDREINLDGGTLVLSTQDGQRIELTLELASDDTLIFEGLLGPQGEAGSEEEREALRVVTTRRDLESFSLTNRAFRWISESPFNR